MKMMREKLGAFDIRVWSGGSGAPLLYLHGFEHHPGAASFLTRLSRNHEVRAPEHPGFGESTSFEENYDVIDVALYYRRVIESWKQGPVDVVGHSLGGMFAAELGALSPQLVRRLVLVDAYGLWLDDKPLPDPFALDRAWRSRITVATASSLRSSRARLADDHGKPDHDVSQCPTPESASASAAVRRAGMPLPGRSGTTLNVVTPASARVTIRSRMRSRGPSNDVASRNASGTAAIAAG